MKIPTDAPKKIFLQHDPEKTGEPFDEAAEVTWCRDRINDTDIEYIRADSKMAYIRDAALEVLRRELQLDDNGDSFFGVAPLPGWETGYCAGLRTAYRALKNAAPQVAEASSPRSVKAPPAESASKCVGVPVEETEDSEGDWQCRDFADGWITFPDRKAAEKYQQQTGAMMRYRRFYTALI